MLVRAVPLSSCLPKLIASDPHQLHQPPEPSLCQLSVPGMGLIIVWCTNNGRRRRRTCPIVRTVSTVEHTLLHGLSFIEELLSFRQSPKNHCCRGLFTQPGLGQIGSWARNVRRMMRQSLMAADPIHSKIHFPNWTYLHLEI